MCDCHPPSSVNVSKECDPEFKSARDCANQRYYNYMSSYTATRPCDPTKLATGDYCKQYNVPADKIDADSDLRPVPTKFKGRGNMPNTMLMGTAPYKAEGEGHLDPRFVDLESRLFMPAPTSRCNRVLNSDRWNNRFDILPNNLVRPGVEPFVRGGVPTRCPTYYTRT